MASCYSQLISRSSIGKCESSLLVNLYVIIFYVGWVPDSQR